VRTVEHDGERYLLLKPSTDTSLVRDPETGETRHLPTDELTATGDPPLAIAATRVPDVTRRLVAGVHSEAALGLLVELDERGPIAVRDLLANTERCESDIHGLVGELRAAGLVAEADVDGQHGYRLTNPGRAGLRTLTT
jgi:hypothetical protein